MLNIDYRDMAIWIEEARKKLAWEQLRAIEAASVAWADKESRREHVRKLDLAARGITEQQADTEQEQEANRAQLRAMLGQRNN